MIYQVIDLLEMSVAFEGGVDECINFVNQNGPSYDIIPKQEEVKLNVFQSMILLLPIGILFWYFALKLIL